MKDTDFASKSQALSAAPGGERSHAVIICLSRPIAQNSQMPRFLLRAAVTVPKGAAMSKSSPSPGFARWAPPDTGPLPCYDAGLSGGHPAIVFSKRGHRLAHCPRHILFSRPESPDSCPVPSPPPGMLCTFCFPRTVGSQGSRTLVSKGSRPATSVPQLRESVMLSGREWRREVDPSEEWKWRGEMEASAGCGMLLAEPEVELMGE